MKRASLQRYPQAALILVLVAIGSLGWIASSSAASPPSIDSESAIDVTEHDATLEAQINPNGAYTAYEFQIDTNASYNYTRMACPLSVPGYMQCMAIIVGEPLPPGLVEPSQGSVPAGFGDQTVSLDLASIGATLQPGTIYHYRVIASNGGQSVDGPDQTFTTPSLESEPPGERATDIGVQSSSTIQSPTSTVRSHRRRHRRGKQKRGHQIRLHRAWSVG